MKSTIKCGKHFVKNGTLSESYFENVCLRESEFDNVNLAGCKINNANMSGMKMNDVNLSDTNITCAQIGGMVFKCIGLPPESEEKQRPVYFENVDLNNSTLLDCNLSGVKIEKCKTDGMSINGIALSELLEVYKQHKRLETK